jgi:hypothetical protein
MAAQKAVMTAVQSVDLKVALTAVLTAALKDLQLADRTVAQWARLMERALDNQWAARMVVHLGPEMADKTVRHWDHELEQHLAHQMAELWVVQMASLMAAAWGRLRERRTVDSSVPQTVDGMVRLKAESLADHSALPMAAQKVEGSAHQKGHEKDL